jgi:uncharacterized protein
MTDRLLTPSKITAFLDCGHYLMLRHRLEVGELSIDTHAGSVARMLFEKGLAHEQACLTHYSIAARSHSAST